MVVRAAKSGVEWPTLLVLAGTYALWALLTIRTDLLGDGLAAALLALVIAQHSSLQHEAIHGHPTGWRWLDDLLVFPALGLLVPYLRFRDTHLAHHHDPILTDPYDDPESNYLDPAVWDRLPRWGQAVLRANNTLAGRMLIGPFVGMGFFVAADLRAVLAGDRRVMLGWLHHGAGLVPVLLWLGLVADIAPVAYLAAAIGGLGILRIRTFLEHRAHERAAARSVIIEDRGPLAFLFLNNNYHAVHHAHPGVAWYRLPGVYAARRDQFLARNGGYRYRSYAAIFARHFLRAKDPVPHPLHPLPGRGPQGE